MRESSRIDLTRWQRYVVVTTIVVAATTRVGSAIPAGPADTPSASLVAAAPLQFPNDTDSNSPAIWEMVAGRWRLSILNSIDGQAQLSEGRSMERMASRGSIAFASAAPHGGVWFESVIADGERWYGFYHNERAGVVCPASGKVWPRIGAARSEDRGRTWVDLGPILETPADTTRCVTNNYYFVGGVGDFSAVLDPEGAFVYLYYTQYVEREGGVGVSVARMAWADRDAPAGRVDIWNAGVWLPPTPIEVPSEDDESAPAEPTWHFPLASPIMVAGDRWDDGNRSVNVFWGPSIHWNTGIERYVMLLNRAGSNEWAQEGVYISYSARIDDPAGWSPPVRLLEGGAWYPQVVGLDTGEGTDTLAGGTARFFMGGRSDHLIVFDRR